MSRSEMAVVNAVESHEWVSDQTGIESSKLRTWYTRNTNGYRDLFVRTGFRPPLLIKDREVVRCWIETYSEKTTG